MGFAGLTDPEGKHSADRTYAMFIGDTVLAGDEVRSLEGLSSNWLSFLFSAGFRVHLLKS